MDPRGIFPSMLLRQESALIHPADLVRQGSNIGELVRQGSLGWQGLGPMLGSMQETAPGILGPARPELTRSDTELSFSMVW